MPGVRPPDKDAVRASGALPLVGAAITLREIEERDVTPAYLGWMNDAELTQHMESRFATHSLESLLAFVRTKRDSALDWMFAICDQASGRHIGNIKLGPINTHHLRADIGVLVGERNWHGRGVATESIRLVAGFAFGVLGLEKITAGMYAGNEASRRAFEKAGFSLEGVLRQHSVDAAGRRVDVYVLGRLGCGEWSRPTRDKDHA